MKIALPLWILAGIAITQAFASNQDFPSTQERPLQQVRTEIPYRDGKVVLLSDYQERISKSRYRARGHVMITFRDMVITSEEVEYDEVTREGVARGTTRFSQKEQWLTCSRAEFNLAAQTATFYDATGYSDQQFLLQGRTVVKTGPDTYTIQKGYITACQERNPKWAFGLSGANLRVDHTARLRHVVFKVKGVPVLYTPFAILPMDRKKRSSGFMPFHTGNSSTKGRLFSQGYFQTLGNSADITLYGDYFTKRGLGVGGVFRARPNADSRIYLQAYGIKDKLNQGGAQIVVDAESQFKNGFRAVASVNATTNFLFRQVFSDGFRSATIPEEHSLLFLTRNNDSFSTNIAFTRDDILLPGRSVVIRKSPSLEFFSLGKPIGNKLPLVFYLRASADGLSRADALIETPEIVQRLDLFPSVSARLPSLAGFSLIPTIGVRETYYSARTTDDPVPEIVPGNLNRHYLDFELDFRTPTLERTFRSGRHGDFKHVVEPLIIYRRIYGIDQMPETIRFDEEDAIADTNEMEYGLVNRIFRSVETEAGGRQEFEFLSFKVAQKYYFDPTFGGAFREGRSNVFYPLNTLSGFSLTGIQRTLSPVNMVLRVSPKPGISYDARADFDTRLHSLRDVSLSTLWQQEKLFIAGTYFKTKQLEPGTFQSDHIQGQVGYGTLERGLSASLTLSYNLQTSKLMNSHSRINYMWNCCGISLEYQQFNLDFRSERRITFSFSLKGIGTFGNLKRPESLF